MEVLYGAIFQGYPPWEGNATRWTQTNRQEDKTGQAWSVGGAACG